ncbi:hypothetical protein GW17_00061842, partial [Ensete ventricosum]
MKFHLCGLIGQLRSRTDTAERTVTDLACSSSSVVGQIQLILVNNCNYSVWPGTLRNAGHLTPKDGGFHLARFEEAVYDVPEGWSGRIWGRTGCCFDEHGGGYCDTGDCGRRLHCMGKWGAPPASVVEMTFGTAPLLRHEPGGGIQPSADVTACCPAEFEVRRGRRVVGCKSACLALKADGYCCIGRYGSPTSCHPTRLSHLFKSICPRAYSYAFDDPSSLKKCRAVATTTNPTASKVPSLSHVLPLRAQKVPSLSLPTPPNKLLFHHNVTLTVPLAVGSPPQNVTMVFDTGSELSWLLCNSSSAAALSFDPQRSSSYYPVPCSSPACSDRGRDLPMPPVCDASSTAGFCHFYLSYADASTAEGVLATDSFLVGSSSPLPTVFGCVASTYSSTGGDTDAAGLLGMNRGSLSFVNQSGIRRFSYCVPDDDASGVVVLGDAEPPF